MKDFLNGSQLIKSSTEHSKYSVLNYTNLQYIRFGTLQEETGRCFAKNGYNSYAEISERYKMLVIQYNIVLLEKYSFNSFI